MAIVVEVTHEVVLVRTPKWLWMSRKKWPKFLRTAAVSPMTKKADTTTTHPYPPSGGPVPLDVI